MPQMETNKSIIKGKTDKYNEEDEPIRKEKEQLIRAYQGYNQELAELKQQSMCLFEDWVTSIYKFKVKKSELLLQFEGFQIRIHPFAIEMILRKVIIEVCEVHKILIEQQMQVMLEENYFKIDAQIPEIGYFDLVSDQWQDNQRIRIGETLNAQRMTVNQQYYQYCVWAIYHHYCSLSECNQEVEGLIEHLRGSMESTTFQMCTDTKLKKLMLDQYGFLESEAIDPTLSAFLSQNQDENNSVDATTLNDYQLAHKGELNILAISNLIPLAMPKIEVKSDSVRFDSDNSSKDLYDQIGRFESTINTIFRTNKQNMRKFASYVEDFRKAIKVLRQRLLITLGNEKYKPNLHSPVVNKDNRNFADLFEDSMLLELADQEIDMQNLGAFKKSLECDQLILNIDAPLSKQNEKSWEISSVLSQEKLKKETKKNEMFETTTQISLKKKSVLTRNFDKSFEAPSKLQTKKIEKKSTSVKIQFVLKSNEGLQSELKELSFGQPKLKKIQSETSAPSLKARMPCKDDLAQKKKIGQKDHRMIEKLKDNLNRMMKESIGQGKFLREDLSFIAKNDKSTITKKLVCYKEENSELNLHQFLQQNQFSHDPDESIMDQQFLQKMEKQVKKKKKKNKKNKKKENEQKQSENQTCETENGKYDPSTFQFVLKQFGYKQYTIIKNLMQMSFQLENRQQCYNIDEETIEEMKKRQQESFQIELKDTTRPASKPKGKTKKQKNT